MEEESAGGSEPESGSRPIRFRPVSRPPFPADTPPSTPPRGRPHLGMILAWLSLIVLTFRTSAAADTLDAIRQAGVMRYGSDMEGGGPYAYPDPSAPRQVIGFEVELMDRLARQLGVRAEFAQGQWDKLLQVLDTGRIDLVVNGYEWTEPRSGDYLWTRPYYIYQLQLMAPRGGPLRSWSDVLRPHPDGRRWQVGVLVSSAADTFVREAGPTVQVIPFDGATDAMTAVMNGQIDGTLQDLPAARFYQDRFESLELAGEPVGRGYYVMFLRKGDEALRDQIDRLIGSLLESGELRSIYERYGIWTELQTEIVGLTADSIATGSGTTRRGLALLRQYSPLLIDAAAMTIFLSITSMPLAMALGLLVALGRLYAPRPVRILLSAYVELLRGTPLMLQLYVLFFLLKLPALVAGVAGLAINYSAYEAEIYRAGLQAIPQGQMEAALALGMTRRQALWRVIIPQAFRIVIPPVTNDFIALFKDTSVCSVITLVELTKQYSILANSTGGVLEFALAAACIYMVLSVPLSWLSRYSEKLLGAEAPRGGALG